MTDAMLTPISERRYLIPFRSQLLPSIFTDTLVIGSGVAGLRAALAAAEHGDVIVIAKEELDRSNTAWAQGGIAAVLAGDDTAEQHVADTLEAGAGLCEPESVRVLVDEGPAEVDWLERIGMRFDRDAGGALSLTREGGHGRRRIVHTDGDATGRELSRALIAACRADARIRLFEKCFALDLVTAGTSPRGDDRVLGAITHHPKYGLQIVWARATIVATGGMGQLWRETSNSRVATGDGVAMAWRAGAEVADLEFVQFHPTALYVAGASRSLISEAVRGEGAHLVDRGGRRFMEGRHPLAELAPRDVVSRGIVEHLAQTQDPCVYLDARHLGSAAFEARFPGLFKLLAGYGIDPGAALIPVMPAAHYTIGGIWSDLDGRTNVPGLFTAGESACNGLHGANRLASNSLLEGLVFGRRAGTAAATTAVPPRGNMRIVSDIRPSDKGELDLVDVRSSLRSAMWRNVGMVRTSNRLVDALDMIHFWCRYSLDKIFDDPAGWEIQNMLSCAAIATAAAHARAESRGAHVRSDFPKPSAAELVHRIYRIGHAAPRTSVVAAPGLRAPAVAR
ncbi:MAG: L-aspartate oxidase [Planctomycetaceae bacterium]|nr:L-aspartate oxidase [Planctomycetaceae bacterium]